VVTLILRLEQSKLLKIGCLNPCNLYSVTGNEFDAVGLLAKFLVLME
jgi:hypothetical protein